MIRISEVIKEIVAENPVLQLGLHEGLFNLTQLAQYIKPMIEVRAKKELSTSAIVMTLSRMQREIKDQHIDRTRFRIENIVVNSRLMTCTYTKTPEAQSAMQKLHEEIQKQGGYMTLSEGTSQITLITDDANEEKMLEIMPGKPLFTRRNVASIGVIFHKDYLSFPGMLYILLQQIALQNINVIEIASTFTEFVIYIDEGDTKIAFDTLYGLFQSHE